MGDRPRSSSSHPWDAIYIKQSSRPNLSGDPVRVSGEVNSPDGRASHLLKPRGIGQRTNRQRLPLREVGGADEARMPEAEAVGHSLYNPFAARGATEDAAAHLAVPPPGFDRALRHLSSALFRL